MAFKNDQTWGMNINDPIDILVTTTKLINKMINITNCKFVNGRVRLYIKETITK